ncbi:LOW QUALITY PROTEIN: hypothetical protein Cgig2_007783 [Carnegiea gigantea]|uniref:Uncharacterized protein n=1 Tax=Carnegiea gigantea TaxID=171969 RepID=A0A9Q1QAP2_9CARY|nr:LOW QUALITY PROTEIN: hypothetical protein Cgig2_007783 [Carnegiea gigantea]
MVSSSSRPPLMGAGGLNSTNLVLTLSSGLAAILYVLDVRFKIALYAEGVRHQALSKELLTLIIRSPIALILGLGRLLSLSFSERHLYLAAASSNLWCSATRSCIWITKMETNDLDFVILIARAKTWIKPNTTNVSCYDLANFSTKARLVEALTAKKSAAEARVCTEGSPRASSKEPRLPETC